MDKRVPTITDGQTYTKEQFNAACMVFEREATFGDVDDLGVCADCGTPYDYIDRAYAQRCGWQCSACGAGIERLMYLD